MIQNIMLHATGHDVLFVYPLQQGTSERVIWMVLTTPAAMVKHIPMMAIANDQFRSKPWSSTLTPKMTMPMNMQTAEMQNDARFVHLSPFGHRIRPIWGPIRKSNIFSVFAVYVIHKFNTYLGTFCS